MLPGQSFFLLRSMPRTQSLWTRLVTWNGMSREIGTRPRFEENMNCAVNKEGTVLQPTQAVDKGVSHTTLLFH